MVSPTRTKTTVEELWQMRHEPYRFALIDGELIRLPGAGGTHRAITAFVDGHLAFFVRPRGLGRVFTETGYRLFPGRDTALIPDVSFVRAARVPPARELERFLRLAPDLAVEIVSPDDTPELIERKMALYFEAGTEQVWLMYPRTRMVMKRFRDGHVMTLGPDDVLDGGDLLPGFAAPVAESFP